MARVGAGGRAGPDGVPRALLGAGREAEPAVRPEDDGEGAAVRVRDGDLLVEEDRGEAGGGPGVPGLAGTIGNARGLPRQSAAARVESRSPLAPLPAPGSRRAGVGRRKS